MAVTKDEILDAISKMSVIEVVELIADMEKKFNVTAAAPVAAARAPAAHQGVAAALVLVPQAAEELAGPAELAGRDMADRSIECFVRGRSSHHRGRSSRTP